MTLKRKLVCFLFILSLSACVSQEEYDKVRAEKEALAAELEEERFSAGKLLKEAKDFLADNNLGQAEQKLNTLLTKHGDKTEAIEAKGLMIELGEKKKIAAENASWNNASNSDDMSYTTKYLNDYPDGKYIAAAKKRLAVLKAKKQEIDYQNALASNSSAAWKRFLEEYPDYPEKEPIRRRIIQAEVDEIMRGDHGELPSLSPTYGYNSSGSSSVSITNETSYELTIRYSGSDVKKIEIPAGGTRSVILSSGTYKIAASVNAYNVRNYAGTETLSGDYKSSYYISSSYY